MTIEKKFENSLVKFAESFYKNLDEYRQKNVNKYYREKELGFSEYTKMERYKNRVRVVDLIFEPLCTFLRDQGIMVQNHKNPEKEDVIK